MAITSKDTLFTNMGKGKGYMITARLGNKSSALTGGGSTSGFHSLSLMLNSTGTTFPSTIVGIPEAVGPTTNLFHVMNHLGVYNASFRGVYLARFYLIGTLAMGSTGNQFTHDTATFPVTRTILGQATQAVQLIPVLYITTAPTVTAPAFIVRDNTGPSTGYKNQAGSNVTGTKTFTLPSATTVTASAFIIPVEDGDSAVTDIVQIDVQTAGTSSPAGNIYGMELIAPVGGTAPMIGMATSIDSYFGGLAPVDLAPAVATSGTATSFLALVGLGATTNGLVFDFFMTGALNS